MDLWSCRWWCSSLHSLQDVKPGSVNFMIQVISVFWGWVIMIFCIYHVWEVSKYQLYLVFQARNLLAGCLMVNAIATGYSVVTIIPIVLLPPIMGVVKWISFKTRDVIPQWQQQRWEIKGGSLQINFIQIETLKKRLYGSANCVPRPYGSASTPMPVAAQQQQVIDTNTLMTIGILLFNY